MVSLGVIGGTGKWGRTIQETIGRMSDVEVAWAVGRHQAWTERHADGVIISSPPALHVEQAVYYLERGVPIWVEKPLSTTYEDAQRLYRLSRELPKVPVLVDHTHLFSSAYEELRRQAKDPRRRGFVSVASFGCGNGPFREDVSGTLDYAPHDLAFMIDLLGLPESGRAVSLPTVTGQGSLARVTLDYPNDVTATCVVGNGAATKERWLRVMTRSGDLLQLDTLAAAPLTLNGRSLPVLEKGRPLDRAVGAFRDAILRKPSFGLGLDIAMGVAHILHGIRWIA